MSFLYKKTVKNSAGTTIHNRAAICYTVDIPIRMQPIHNMAYPDTKKEEL